MAQRTTSFITLPRELRQKILLEAVITLLQEAIDTQCLFSVLISPPALTASGSQAASSLAAACCIISTIAGIPEIAGDVAWIDEKGVVLLEGYRGQFGTAMNRHFRGLAAWVVRGDGSGGLFFKNFCY